MKTKTAKRNEELAGNWLINERCLFWMARKSFVSTSHHLYPIGEQKGFVNLSESYLRDEYLLSRFVINMSKASKHYLTFLKGLLLKHLLPALRQL